MPPRYAANMDDKYAPQPPTGSNAPRLDPERTTRPSRPLLQGATAYVADGARHLLALVIASIVLGLPLWVGTLLDGWSPDILIGWAGIVVAFALATLAGHLLVTRLRGFVSLPTSFFFTWLALLGMMTVIQPEAEVIATNLFFGVLLCTPLALGAFGLRLLIPSLRVHVNGRPVRVTMTSRS